MYIYITYIYIYRYRYRYRYRELILIVSTINKEIIILFVIACTISLFTFKALKNFVLKICSQTWKNLRQKKK